MNKPYTHERLEKKWQKEWEKKKLYKAANTVKGKKNEMILVEFPYPSGNLHVGHWYAFALPDIYARFRRMQGKNVLYPIGFDAFGLPAENAAIKNGVNPKTWTYKNMAHMRKQIASMGTMFDWSREVVTCDPSYYKWTQKLFLELYKKGLVYRKPTVANWCPKDKTVLANEQVVGGCCERCGTEVVQREMPQWNIAITKYADRLVDDLDTLDWPEPIKESQRNWIGRSVGAEIDWRVCDKAGNETGTVVTTFTTRKDTIPGVTYIVVAPEHRIVSLLTTPKHVRSVADYQEQISKMTDLERQENKEKSGVPTGSYAKNPFNGSLVPVYIASYVLAGYGTGCVMGMGGHDERDRAFAIKHGLPIIFTTAVTDEYADTNSPRVWSGDGAQINTGEGYDGLSNIEAGQKIFETLQAHGTARAKTTYRLRDWIVSRQRYWGVPIPMLHCTHCEDKEAGLLASGKKVTMVTNGYHPVPDKELPVVLPRVDEYLPAGEGKSPLARATRWMKVKCPVCKSTATRETDTFDTFICSSWYYLRYTDPKNTKMFASKDALKSWVPVDIYSGGAEHTTMHLLYSRFWHKALYDLKLVHSKEPYTRRLNRGIILGPDGHKMSKSKGNVIDPDSVVERLGTDTVRMYLAFIGPFNEVGSYPWNSDSIAGVRRFIERVWKLKHSLAKKSTDTVDIELHRAIKKVTDDISKLQFNTAIASLMSFLNVAEKGLSETGTASIAETEYATLLALIAPFAPHMTEEVWHILGHKTSIHLEKWPTYNAKKIAAAPVTIGVQVNGKVRGSIQIHQDATQNAVLAEARIAVAQWLNSQTLLKEIYVPGKIVSFVVSPA